MPTERWRGGTADDASTAGVHPLFHHKAHKQLRMALQLLLPIAGQLGSFGRIPRRTGREAGEGPHSENRMERAADRVRDKTRMRAERHRPPRWSGDTARS